jgi:hypothetical protein
MVDAVTTTQIVVQPRVFKDYRVAVFDSPDDLAAPSFEKATSSVSLTPSASTQTWQGGTPESSYSDISTATWVNGLDYAQDWETPESLSLYLLNNEGEEKCLVFSPLAGKGLVFAVRVVLTPGAIGGAIGSYGTASVTLPVRGRPRYAATGPAALALLADED